MSDWPKNDLLNHLRNDHGLLDRTICQFPDQEALHEHEHKIAAEVDPEWGAGHDHE